MAGGWVRGWVNKYQNKNPPPSFLINYLSHPSHSPTLLSFTRPLTHLFFHGISQYDDNAGERSILLFHVHVFVETRLRWNDEEDIYEGKYQKKGKGEGKREGKNGQGSELRSEKSKHNYREDERLLPLFVPRDGYEYFPPHMIVYQRALASNN